MEKILLILCVTFLFSCSDKAVQNSEAKEGNAETIREAERDSNNIPLDSLWVAVTQKSSCLTGGQYEVDGKFRSEGCIMERLKEWEILFKKPKKNLTEFLLTKLEKTDTTNVHTCPFFLSTEGELAVYTLQRIYKKNWYDFDEFKVYRERAEKSDELPLSNTDNYQGWLQNEILKNSEKRELLKTLWIAEMNK